MANIVCSGPGPHAPSNGVLGTSDRPQTAFCASTACQAAATAGPTASALLDANDQAINDALAAALARLTQIKNQGDTLAASSGTTWTQAERRAVGAAISDLALIERQLIRKLIRVLDGST